LGNNSAGCHTDTSGGGNTISNITPLAVLTNLETLTIRTTDITDISSLSGLTNLVSLDLSGNEITDWSPVDHVESVQGRP
jgi:internalin A